MWRCDAGSRYGKYGRSVRNDIFTAVVRAAVCFASILKAVIVHRRRKYVSSHRARSSLAS